MSNQKGFVNIILIVLVVILAGTAGYFALSKKTPNESPVLNNENITPSNNLTTTSETTWKVYSGNGFSVKYPENIFTMFELEKYSTPKNKINASKVKLISTAHASNIGKKECRYNGNNEKEVCTIEAESGIIFNDTDGPILDYTSLIEGDGGKKTTVTIGGKQFIESSRTFPNCTYPKDKYGEEQKICSGGSGLDIYYISLNPNRTLMIMRNDNGDNFPQQSLFNQVLTTLTIK